MQGGCAPRREIGRRLWRMKEREEAATVPAALSIKDYWPYVKCAMVGNDRIIPCRVTPLSFVSPPGGAPDTTADRDPRACYELKER